MIKINLLAEGKRPAAVRKKKAAPAVSLGETDVNQWLVLGLIVLSLLVFGIYWLGLNRTIGQKDQEIEVAQREVEELEPIIREVEEFKAKRAELLHKIEVITQLKANQRGPVKIMDHTSRALPDLVWLERMQVTADTITFHGRALNENAVAAFIENLDKVSEFQEPELREMRQDRATFAFNVVLHYFLGTEAEGEATGDTG
jgi:type IV pilus assembly protein PilN